MAEIRVRVAVVDPNDMNRATLCNMLMGLESEGIWLDADCNRYDFFQEVITSSNPDVALVALDGDALRSIQLIEQLHRERPSLRILAISSRAELLLKSIKAGANEPLTHPVELGELQAALKGAGHGPAQATGKVISILGSRGGVGCTSLAVNLGCTLSQDKNNKVVLIDLDLALGDADVALDLMPDFSLSDLIIGLDRLDMSLLKRSLTEHKSSGLFLLPHPVQMQDVSMIQEDEEHMRRVLELPRVVERVVGLLRSSYSHLVLDLSKGLTPTDMTAVHLSDIVLLVAQLELTSLRNVVRIMHTLGDEAGLKDKIEVVLNRTGSDFMGGEISVKRAEETIGKPVYWQIPNDTKSMLGARNAGVPINQFAPKSKAQASFFGLAQLLCGANGQAPAQPAAKPKGMLRSFFDMG